MAGLVNSIKNDVKKAGTSKGNFTFIREGQKIRVRFLQDMDDGMEITFHDSFADSINVPCQESFDRECPYCEDDRVRTRSQYIWCVYNYESKKVELFMFPVNNCSPVPALLAMYDTYGTITDRDYVISVSGKGPDKKYAVVPMDKAKFRNEKAKPFSESKILSLLDKAYPCEDEDGNVLGGEDDEDDFPTNKPSNKAKKGGKNTSAGKSTSKKKKAQEDDEDDDYDDEDWGDEEDDEAPDYSEMSAKELYKLCKERDLDVEAKKPQKYYIKQLEAADQAEDDWGDSDDDDDEWEDDDEEVKERRQRALWSIYTATICLVVLMVLVSRLNWLSWQRS